METAIIRAFGCEVFELAFPLHLWKWFSLVEDGTADKLGNFPARCGITKQTEGCRSRQPFLFQARTLGVVVQLVRIPACHAGGRGFESRPLRQ